MFVNLVPGHLPVALLAFALLPMLASPSPAGTTDPEAFLGRELASHRFVLLGEKHDNPEHHLIQARLLARMVEFGRRPAVVWEMIARGKQPAIDFLAGSGNTDPDRFAAAIGWADSGWPDWNLYRPIAEVALAAGLPMVAGNIDRATVRTIARDPESLDPNMRKVLGMDKALPGAVSEAIGDEVYRGHCELVPREHLEPMIRVQAARNASLAEAMVRAGEAADGAVLIAGGQHVRKDIGAGFHLADRFGIRDVASIALLERSDADPAMPDPALTRKFDFVWITARAHPDKDYCADLAARFGKHK